MKNRKGSSKRAEIARISIKLVGGKTHTTRNILKLALPASSQCSPSAHGKGANPCVSPLSEHCILFMPVRKRFLCIQPNTRYVLRLHVNSPGPTARWPQCCTFCNRPFAVARSRQKPYNATAVMRCELTYGTNNTYITMKHTLYRPPALAQRSTTRVRALCKRAQRRGH